jgi:hypothetical protein
MTSDTGGAGSRFLAAVQAAALQPEVVSAWNDITREPAPGQLWRVSWADEAEMVVLIALEGDTATAMPVTVDIDFADEQTVRVPSKMTSVGTPLAFWTGLLSQLPLFVLDRPVGQVEAHWFLPSDLNAAADDGSASRGEPVHDVIDRRTEYRARLIDTMVALSTATWVPEGTGQLGQQLVGAGLQPADVVALLSVGPQAALALLRGRLPVTPEQADVLAERLNVTSVDVLAANPPPPADLVARLNQPRRRPQLRALADRKSTDERSARLSAAYGTWRLAARQTGGHYDPAWDERLDRYFHATLDG